MTTRIGIAIIGVGKIARDEHLPAIAASPTFDLVAVSNVLGPLPSGVIAFDDHKALLAAPLAIDAVAICTPPAVRHAIAAAALAAGKHVLLEKPPAATPGELAELEGRAARHGRVLFAAWHSRYNAAVEQARAWLTGRVVAGLAITWKEDVRRWHPGQDWIFRPGGFGVFDPGINALSIATHILPEPLLVREAKLLFAAQTDAPIAADLAFRTGDVTEGLRAAFDWRPTDTETGEVAVVTSDGHQLLLSERGGCLALDGDVVVREVREEYQGVYRHFATLLRQGICCVDGQPLRITADAFLLGRRDLS